MKPDDISFLVDDSIPCFEQLFNGLGDVRFFDRVIGGIPDDGLARADVLAVTSSTLVDADLLSRCDRLRVLATPVVGTDHIDFDAVAAAGQRIGHPITVVNAPGSTAQAVADWTVGAMLAALGHLPSSVAIVGFGACGRAVAERLRAIAVPFVTCDPLLAGAADDFRHTPLESLNDVEVATFHVPLTFPGQSPFPTADMINATFVQGFMSHGGRLVVNCSRGGILDETMFAEIDDSGRRYPSQVVPVGPAAGMLFALDVFRGEPAPARTTVAAAAIATPHVAGSGNIGRFNAAKMVRAETCRILGLKDKGITPPDRLLASRPILRFDSDQIRTADGFREFAAMLAELSGVAVHGSFRDFRASQRNADLPDFFRWTRGAALRTEPIWTQVGTD